jgi:hypothetical protein
LESTYEPKSKDRDRFALLLAVRREHYHCFDRAPEEGTAKDKRNSGEKSGNCPPRLASGLISSGSGRSHEPRRGD